jgi:uncharacterized protein (DUF2267 family)
MSTTILNKSLHKAYVWLHDVDDKLDTANLDSALAALRAVLHEIRNHLPINDSAHLSEQFPTLIRGLYYENWKPDVVPIKDRSSEAFTQNVRKALYMHPEISPAKAILAVFDTLSIHIGVEEIDKILALLPKNIRHVLTEVEYIED